MPQRRCVISLKNIRFSLEIIILSCFANANCEVRCGIEKQEAYLAYFDAHDIRQEAERIKQKELN